MTPRQSEESKRPTGSWHGWAQLLISVVVLVVGLGKVLRDVEEHALLLKDHENRIRNVEICSAKVETTLTYIDKRMSQIAVDIQQIADVLKQPRPTSYLYQDESYTPATNVPATTPNTKLDTTHPTG